MEEAPQIPPSFPSPPIPISRTYLSIFPGPPRLLPRPPSCSIRGPGGPPGPPRRPPPKPPRSMPRPPRNPPRSPPRPPRNIPPGPPRSIRPPRPPLMPLGPPLPRSPPKGRRDSGAQDEASPAHRGRRHSDGRLGSTHGGLGYLRHTPGRATRETVENAGAFLIARVCPPRFPDPKQDPSVPLVNGTRVGVDTATSTGPNTPVSATVSPLTLSLQPKRRVNPNLAAVAPFQLRQEVVRIASSEDIKARRGVVRCVWRIERLQIGPLGFPNTP